MIQLENVSFTYHDSEQGAAVQQVSLRIPAGEAVLLCGKSGCGKTSLIRMINGLIPHYYQGELQGSITVDGKDITTEKVEDIAQTVGSVFQNPRSQFFNVDTTSELVFGCENLAFAVPEIEERLVQKVARFSLDALMNRSLFELSGGEKQRIACAAVDMAQPDILVLDEPTSNLDMKSIQMLRGVLQRWKQAGKTIVIAEHRLSYLRDIVDRVVFMEDGRISFDVPTAVFRNMQAELPQKGLRTLQDVPFVAKPFGQEQACGIQVENLTMRRQNRTILQINEMFLPAGCIIGLIGNNGAGKSSFAKCLCGLEKANARSFLRQGRALSNRKRMKQSYLVMQDVNHQLFTESVEDEITLGAKGVFAQEEQINPLLEKLGLAALKSLHPMSLSGGEKQRVAIASAITSQRDILLYDEPTSGLDFVNMNRFAAQLKELSRPDLTQIVITHDPELVALCCDYIICLEQGKLAWQGYLDAVVAEKLRAFFAF